MSNYSIEALMSADGELIGKPQLKVPHPILLKFIDLLEFYETLEDKTPEAVDKQLDYYIQKQIARTIAKYNVNKRERKIASELKQYSDALQLFFYDLEDQSNET